MRTMALRGYAIVPTDGKRPLVDGWQRRGVPTADELAEWLHRWPRCNYGILTGRASGLDCFDFDVEGNGWALMATWCALVELVGQIPATWAHATGNGLHVFVEHIPGAGSHPRICGLPVDYLSDGRQVIGPGSIHPSGKVYAECEPALPVAALPDPGRLVEALNRHSAPSAVPKPVRPGKAPRRALRRRGRLSGAQALEGATARISAARIGTRNDTLNREAYYLAPYVADGELARAELEDACSAAAARALLEAREIAATLHSALTAGIRDSAPLEACEHPPDPSPRRGMTRARRKPRRPLTPWAWEALTPALALIARTAAAAAWDWDGAEADRRVFDSLMGRAQDVGESLEVEASLRWLSEQTGIHTHYVRASLSRLCDHGWLYLVRQGGPTGEHSVRAPSAYRLRIPAEAPVPAPCYPRTPRAHQLELPSMGGSTGVVSEAREALEVPFGRRPRRQCRMTRSEPPEPRSRAMHPREESMPGRLDELLARWSERAAGAAAEGAGRPHHGQPVTPRRMQQPGPRGAVSEDDCEAERRRQLAALAAWDP